MPSTVGSLPSVQRHCSSPLTVVLRPRHFSTPILDESMTPFSCVLCFGRSKVGSVMPVDEFPSVEKPGNSTMSQVDGGSDGGSALPAVAPRAAFDEDNPDEESSATAKMSLGTKVKILITFFQVCSVFWLEVDLVMIMSRVTVVMAWLLMFRGCVVVVPVLLLLMLLLLLLLLMLLLMLLLLSMRVIVFDILDHLIVFLCVGVRTNGTRSCSL